MTRAQEGLRRRIYLLARKIYFPELGPGMIQIGKVSKGYVVAVGHKVVMRTSYKQREKALREIERLLEREADKRRISYRELKKGFR